MEDWILGLTLALFIIIPCWMALSRQRDVERQVQAWMELAQRSGLTFDSNIFNAPARVVHSPGVHGQYRNRPVSITLLGVYERDVPAYYLLPPHTSISIQLKNCARVSLCIQAKTFHEYMQGITEVHSGNLGFDGHFNVKSSPYEYVQSAIDLMLRNDTNLLSWILQHFPSIELREENLTCRQNGELTSVDDQLALLNLLCDLAELAEQIASKAEKDVAHD